MKKRYREHPSFHAVKRASIHMSESLYVLESALEIDHSNSEKKRSPASEIFRQIRHPLARLAELYEVTSPDIEESEHKKYLKALDAIDCANQINTILAGWAYKQIFGYHYRVSEADDNLQEEQTPGNSHHNEFLIEDDFILSRLSPLELRKAISKVLCPNIFIDNAGNTNDLGWRELLARSLIETCHGQKSDLLFTPIQSEEKVSAKHLLKHFAVCHVYALWGSEVSKKKDAQEIVSEACRSSIETLRGWERNITSKFFDPDHVFRDSIKAYAPCLNIKNLVLDHKAIEQIKSQTSLPVRGIINFKRILKIAPLNELSSQIKLANEGKLTPAILLSGV